jgi:hypothetical protein
MMNLWRPKLTQKWHDTPHGSFFLVLKTYLLHDPLALAWRAIGVQDGIYSSLGFVCVWLDVVSWTSLVESAQKWR